MTNKYKKRSRISEAKIRQIMKLFALDIEATKIAELTGLSRKTNINAFYILEGGYIDGALSQIERKYGGIENYLEKGLGLSDDEIDKLKETLLNPK